MQATATPAAPDRWTELGLSGTGIDRDDAERVLNDQSLGLLPLLHAAGTVRRHYFQDSVTIHVLDNVRNGACPEDCGYCGQSNKSRARIQPYKLKEVDAILRDAAEAQRSGAYRFCMALSGRGPSDRDIDHMCAAIRKIRAMGMRTCLSAGLLDTDKAKRLREAGLDRLNHNLNTSRERYPEICTTHTYDDRIETLRAAREAGIGLCSGLIVGMDETGQDLIEVAFKLREIRAESIPVNFLLPIDGNRVRNPCCDGRELTPQFVLRVLCMIRLVNPDAEVRIAAGREVHLRGLQALALWPANSLFMEGYLLTEGQGESDTYRMILDAGFHPVVENESAIPPSVLESIRGDRSGAGYSTHTYADSHSWTAPLKLSVSRKTPAT